MRGWRGEELRAEKRGESREEWLIINSNIRMKMTGFGNPKSNKERKNTSHRAPQNNGEALLNKAINYHVRGDLANAEKHYREAIESGLSNVALYSNLGVICKRSQRTEEAIALYKKAIQINPHHPDAYTNLGSLYKNLGNLDQALAFTLKSLELKPNDPTTLMNVGGIYKDLGNLDQALASTLKSLELKPDNPTAHMNLGGIYKDLGNLEQALDSTLKSLALNPDNPDALINLGGIYMGLGNLDQAVASTLKSLELKPDNPVALTNLFNSYGEGDLPVLKSTARRALEHNQEILNDLTYIEALSSLGKDFAKTLFPLQHQSINQ